MIAMEKTPQLKLGNVRQALAQLMEVEGAFGAALVDYESGNTLGQIGGEGQMMMEIAAAGNTAVMRAKMKVMRELGLSDSIEDILISLSTQYHLIRPLSRVQNVFLYCVFERDRANLGMARHKLSAVERELEI